MSKKKRLKNRNAAAPVTVAPTPVADDSRSRGRAMTQLFACVVALFFASGFSSLIYQVVWTRMLVLVFGATTFATSTVLAVFMGGLALGSLIAGRISDRLQRPLLWYGVLEAIIGVWSLCTPFMFESAMPIYRAVWQATHASLPQLSLVRFACAFVILIVPTTCMGATLPILSRFVTNSLESVGNRVGTLYSVNTLGAVVGAIAAGFFILPSLGLHATILVSAAINVLLLVIVLALNALIKTPALPAGDTANGAEQTPPQKLPMQLKLAVGAFAISGGIAMVYEVCWTRTLLMVIGSSTYAFTVMLSTFLIGIFVGSLVCARFIDKTKQPLLWFAIFQLFLGVSTLISMHSFNYVPYLNLILSAQTKADPNMSMLLRFLLAGSMMAPITLFLGAVFPAVVKACTTDLARVGRSVGFLYSWNTLGAIVGAFLAGFVCLPLFGAERSLIYGAVINAALGIMLLWCAVPLEVPRRVVITASVVFTMLSLLLTTSVWDKNILLNAQAARRGVSLGLVKPEQLGLDQFEHWKKKLNDTSVVRYWADGACSNVGVVYHPREKITSLMTNGHIDASDSNDVPVQELLAGFPMLMKPDAKDVAVIGWGCGQTVGVCTKFPLKDLDAIELEPKVIEASKLFHHVNGAPENDPRVHLQYNDGRNFMLATDKKYDVIISEPSNPWQAGVCNLFTKEYFSICRKRLKDDGLLSIWIQCTEVPPGDLCAVMGALKSEFTNCMIFVPCSGNLVAVASQQPLKINYSKLRQFFQANPKLAADLAHARLDDEADMVARIGPTNEALAALIVPTLNTDDRNMLEFDVGKSYEDKMFGVENVAIIYSLNVDPWKHVDFSGMTKDQEALALARIAQLSWRRSENKMAPMTWLNRSLAVKPTAEAYRVRGDVQMQLGHRDEAFVDFKRAVELKPDDEQNQSFYGAVLVTMNRREEGRQILEKCLAKDPTDLRARMALASSYSLNLLGGPSDDEETRKIATRVVALLYPIMTNARELAVRPGALVLASSAALKLGEFKRAREYAVAYQQRVGEPDASRVNSLIKLIDSHSK